MTWAMTYTPQPQVKLPAYTFDREREQCERCAHVKREGQASLQCRKTECTGHRFLSCSSARQPDGVCGPNASLFKAK